MVTFAGNSNLWAEWTKERIREYLHANIRRSVADLKRGLVLRGDIEPGDEAEMVSLIPEPDDILVVFAGGEESIWRRLFLAGGRRWVPPP